jgi:PIN domain nuclease of toxin-antitoxin system
LYTAAACVPEAVLWEVTLLARAGRFNLRCPARAFFDDQFSSPARAIGPTAPATSRRRRSSVPTDFTSIATRSTR